MSLEHPAKASTQLHAPANNEAAKSDKPSAVELIGLSKQYKGREIPAVNDCSLSIRDGEFVALLGPSGCGKTTTLRMISGFIRPDSGHIVVHGSDVTYLPPNKRNVGLVFQDYSLFPHMTVGSNVGYGLRVRRVPKPERKRRVAESLDLVRLGGREGSHPNELSGGEKQRVALARALVTKPEVLLLDEPLSNLDARLRASLRTELRQLQQHLRMTAIIVTHDQEEALTMADRIAVMNGGKIEQIGSPEEVYERPRSEFVAGFVGERNSFSARVVEISNSKAVLRTDGGNRMTAIAGDAGLSCGERVVVTIPSTEVELSRAGNNDGGLTSGLTGVLLSRKYLGSQISYTARVEDETFTATMAKRNTSQPALRPGDAVRLTWPEEACWILTAQ